MAGAAAQTDVGGLGMLQLDTGLNCAFLIAAFALSMATAGHFLRWAALRNHGRRRRARRRCCGCCRSRRDHRPRRDDDATLHRTALKRRSVELAGVHWCPPLVVLARALGIAAAAFLVAQCFQAAGTFRPAAHQGPKIITFVLEQTWSPTVPYGKGGWCHSGGFSHASNLLQSFFEVASYVAPHRRVVVLRPREILEPEHGDVPGSLRWGDWFAWDVDDDELATHSDVWNAHKADAGRVEFFDSRDLRSLRRMRASTAPVIVVHLYGTPRDACFSYMPMLNLAARAREPTSSVGFHPSQFMLDASDALLEKLGGSAADLTTVHLRRGDVLTRPGVGYYGYSGKQLALATSPKVVARAIARRPPTETVVVFTNEKNLTMFDGVKARFGPRVTFFADLVKTLDPDRRAFFENGYSEYLLSHVIAQRGRFHVCTAWNKMGAPCDHKLVWELRRLCPFRAGGPCGGGATARGDPAVVVSEVPFPCRLFGVLFHYPLDCAAHENDAEAMSKVEA